MKDTFNKK